VLGRSRGRGEGGRGRQVATFLCFSGKEQQKRNEELREHFDGGLWDLES